MEKIVFLERNTFRVKFRRPSFPHEWVEYDETDASQTVNRLTGVTIVISNKLPLRAAELAQLPQLKLIAVAATGVDNIDLEFCRQHHIAVSNTRNYAGLSLPEHVLMLILALRRNLFAYRDDVKAGKWQLSKQFCLLDHEIHDIGDSRLGIVGYGYLGRSVAQLAEAVGLRVQIAERKGATEIRAGRISFADVLRQSDIVSLHCPLTEETKNMIAEAEFGQMKPNALLINTARGGLVSSPALIAALKTGLIAGAGIDVLPTEPPKDGDPLLQLDLPNLVVTPHVAWASREAMENLADQLIENMEAFVRGERLNRVV